MKATDEPVIVEETFAVLADIVWRAITDVDEMTRWFFDNIPSFKSEVGFKTQFTVRSGERAFRHLWEITEVLPMRKIVYSWKYEGYPGEASVLFELTPEGKSTRLKLTNIVLEDFPDDIPEFKRESCVAGWEYFIQGRLKEYLEST